MYQTSLLFKIKDSSPIENHKIIELFFKSWVDDICHNEVHYEIERDVTTTWEPGAHIFNEVFRVEFEHSEDAVALRLKGIPAEFSNYIEIIV